MSAPTWTPAKLSCVLLKHFDVAVDVPRGGVEEAPAEIDVDLISASPPTARAHTPPPGWLGMGLAGAETNALPCWVRKTLLTLPMAPAIAAPEAPAGIASWVMLVIWKVPVCVLTQFGVG